MGGKAEFKSAGFVVVLDKHFFFIVLCLQDPTNPTSDVLVSVLDSMSADIKNYVTEHKLRPDHDKRLKRMFNEVRRGFDFLLRKTFDFLSQAMFPLKKEDVTSIKLHRNVVYYFPPVPQ